MRKQVEIEKSIEPEWLIEDVVPARGIVLVTGGGPLDRLRLAQELVHAAHTGRPWRGYAAHQGDLRFFDTSGPALLDAEARQLLKDAGDIVGEGVPVLILDSREQLPLRVAAHTLIELDPSEEGTVVAVAHRDGTSFTVGGGL